MFDSLLNAVQEISHAPFHRRHPSHQHRRHPRAADAPRAHAGSRSRRGKRFQTAAEDPIAATRAAALDRTVADNEQFARNSNIIESRLNYEEQSLADVTLLLQKARDLALQGANSTLGPGERRMLATERARSSRASSSTSPTATTATANTCSPARRPARSRSRSGTTGVNYLGDQTTRLIRVSGSQAIADGHTGTEVFMNITQANGTFRTAVNAANTGSGTIDVGTRRRLRRVGRRQLHAAVHERRPTGRSKTTRCRRRCSRERHAASSSGQTHQLPGRARDAHGHAGGRRQLRHPARADTDMFAMLDDLIDDARWPASGLPSDRAMFQHQIGASIANLDQGLDARAVACAPKWARGSPRSTSATQRARDRGHRSAAAALGPARRRLRRGHQQAEPGIRGTAGRAGRVYQDRAALAVRLFVGITLAQGLKPALRADFSPISEKSLNRLTEIAGVLHPLLSSPHASPIQDPSNLPVSTSKPAQHFQESFQCLKSSTLTWRR